MRTAMILAVILLVFPVAYSATIVVPDDYPTIQQAIDAAVTGDTVLVTPGTYVENIDFKGKAIAVTSEEGATETVIDGNELGSVVTCKSGEDENSILDGFTITFGYADHGAGMFNYGSSPTVKNCIFTHNKAKGYGGGMHNEYSDPKVTNCTFSDCHAFSGGGGGMHNYVCSPEVKNCIFVENYAKYHGGGMLNGFGDPTLVHCTFGKNTVDYDGGGVANVHCNATMTNCIFDKNTGPTGGGGMDNDDSNPTLTDCTFSENDGGTNGGGMANGDSDPTVIRCTFSGNEADHGGGMCNLNSEPKVFSSTFSGNTAVYGGGGVLNDHFSDSTITNCIFTHNMVTTSNTFYDGGGMCNKSSSPTVSNCTFFANEAVTGGGMCNRNNSSPTVINCTLFKNMADSGGGMYLEDHSNPEVTNTIFWENVALAGPEIWIGTLADPSTLTISYSDVKGGQSSVHINGGTLNWGAGMINADPFFVDATDGDFHLTYPSPCKDAGTNFEVTEQTDIEGDPRIAYGTVDMGADEFYTHLYYTGNAAPTGSVEVKFVGHPGSSPIGLWIAFKALETPIPGAYGDWWLLPPMIGPVLLGSIPANGVSVLPGALPPVPYGPYTLYLQGIMGTPLKLTNLCVMKVK